MIAKVIILYGKPISLHEKVFVFHWFISFLPILHKPDSFSWSLRRFFGLQLCQSHANGIKLGTSWLVDVVLIVKNVLNIELQILEILAKLCDLHNQNIVAPLNPKQDVSPKVFSYFLDLIVWKRPRFLEENSFLYHLFHVSLFH